MPGLWLFEPAEPEQVVFAVDYTDRADEDYLALFEAAGWHRVLGVANMQIFKAAPGTRPIHTDPGAEAEALAAQAGRLGRWAAACLAVLAVVALVCALTDLPRWFTVLAVIAAGVPAVYTVILWLGTRWRLHVLRAPRR